MKLLKVGAYWQVKQHNPSLTITSGLELHLRTCFIKWKNQVAHNHARLPFSHTHMVTKVKNEILGKSVPVKMEEESSVKQTLDWLYTFDQKPGENKAATAIQ